MKLSETERVVSSVLIDNKDVQGYLLNLLNFYARNCKFNGRFQLEKDLKKNINDLFGLVRSGKFDIDKAPFKFLNIIGMATIEYRDALSNMKEMNTIIGDRVATSIEKQLNKNKGEIPEKYTPKQMASFNLYWNKHMMEEYKFSPKVRVMIYHLIDLKIKSDVKPDEKSKALMVETNNFNVYFIAKISNGITLYRITKIEKKHPGI